MLRNHGSLIKWLLYSAVFFLFFFLECCIFNRYPIHGAVPVLAPLTVITVACFEGSLSGSLMGLAVGTLCSLVYYRGGALMIPVCTVLGMLAGITTTRQMGKTLPGTLLCDVEGIFLLEFFQVSLQHVFLQTELDPLLQIAVPEGLYSLLFALPVYWLYRLIYHRFRTDFSL